MSHRQGTWTTVFVSRHPCLVYEPAMPSPHGYVMMYLHGLHMGLLSDHPAFTSEFDRYGLRVVCPVTRRSWWTDRICPDFDTGISAEHFVMDRVVTYIAERWGTTPPRIALLGTSMGGQGALRLAYKYPDTFPVVAALAPAIDYHQKLEAFDDEQLALMYDHPEAARQDTAILHVHPLNWPRHQYFCCDPTDELWWNSSDRLRMKLRSLGIPFECDLETIAGGHGFEYYDQMAGIALEFVVNRLDRERLRLPDHEIGS